MRLDELYILNSFKITQIIRTSAGNVLLVAASSSPSAICPYCQTFSKKRHSVYIRKPQALFDDLGCNMIRCWGGNVYEDQHFFDLCDDKGIWSGRTLL